MKKKFLFSSLLIAIFLFLFSIFPSPIQAGYLDLVGQNPTETFKQSLDSNTMNYSQFNLYALQNTMSGATKLMIGYPQLEGESIASTNAQSSLAFVIGSLYTNKPSSVAQYVAYVKQKLPIAQSAYAATGEGWSFLSPLLNIWVISRNIAYLFFVVAFIGIGFAIMFRSKLNPQTVINLQLALPKIIVSLLMVTFSYALSGLIVDVVFFGNDLIRNIIASESNSTSQHLVFKDPKTFWENDPDNNMFTPSAWPIDILDKYGGGDGIAGILLKGISNTILGLIKQDFIGELFKLIISASIVGATFKIFFSLLTKYIMIIILVISMPLTYLFGAFSAQSNPLKPLKGLLANTIAFPITSLLLAIAYYFSSSTAPTTQNLPPFYINDFGKLIDAQTISASLVAIGILMSIPTILASIDKALEAQPIAQGASEQISGVMRKIPIIGGLMG